MSFVYTLIQLDIYCLQITKSFDIPNFAMSNIIM
jgi:hypothetical protein